MKKVNYSSADGKYSLRMHAKHLDQMRKYCLLAGRNETGGLLAGFYGQGLDCAYIRSVTGPTPDSSAGRTWFKRGVHGLASWFMELWIKDACYFLGEWHFHPFAAPTPSRMDFDQMRKIAQDESWQCKVPLLMILGGDPNSHFDISIHACPKGQNPVALIPLPAAEGSHQER